MNVAEYHECKIFCLWMDAKKVAYCHIPNHSYSARNGARLKAQGMKAGFPDYLIFLGGGRVIAWEMKKDRRTKPRSNQLKWLNVLDSLGIPNGWGPAEDAIDFVASCLDS